MLEKVKLYTTNNCGQCKMTKMVLEREGMPVDKLVVINMSENKAAREHVKNNMGFKSAPVIDAPGFEAFHGFRPDKLRLIAESFK